MHACRQLVRDLNQFLRRLRLYETEAGWVSALLDGASHFARQVAVFTIEGDRLRLRGSSGLNIPAELIFPVRSAGAFQAAIASRDPVIALRTAAEISEPLSAAEPGERAHLIPILNASRAVAVLFAAGAADSDSVDVNALELLAGMASLVLERHSNLSLHAQIANLPPTGKHR